MLTDDEGFHPTILTTREEEPGRDFDAAFIIGIIGRYLCLCFLPVPLAQTLDVAANITLGTSACQ